MGRRRDDSTNQLAVWFVETILRTKFDYRSGAHKMQLAKARDLVNPKKDPITGEKPPAYSIEEVKEAIIALRDGKAEVTDYLPFGSWAEREGWKPPHMLRSLGILFTQTPTGRTFVEAVLTPPEPPAKFNLAEFAEWVKKHGERALRIGMWDGIFLWLPSEEPIQCGRMTYDELAQIVGEELANRGLILWEAAKDATHGAV